MSAEYLLDRSGEPDPDAQRLEQLLAPLAHDAPLDQLSGRRPNRRPWLAIAMAAGVAAAAAIVLWIALPGDDAREHDAAGGFSFVAIGGDVSFDGAPAPHGTLAPGGTLDTGANQAVLAIASIGHADLGPHTRVRLERSDATRHQLALDRGRLHAKVNAPPRLFQVTTPRSQVVDLGCEYTIAIDDAGEGSIAVQSGKVELAVMGEVVVAPAGTSAAIVSGLPGLPVRGAASLELVAAAHAHHAGDPHAVDAMLAAAEPADAITVVALAAVARADRARVLARLAELAPPPPGVTVETATHDPAALVRWRDHILAGMRGKTRGKAG
jgi:hypothetical protein